ncbi:NCS2 family permease [Aerococcaceae bacterium DSM 111022]|nr:NCS2 family permease [Aerococcaceae bacterium DSM 111022]
MKSLEKYFDFEGHDTTLTTEISAGITTFLAMSYIIFVNPAILSQTGMPQQAVFLATLFASAISTLFIGLYANVPYALAPGMGLNAFFAYTVVFALGFTWQEALSMVFICGVFNVIITITNIRKVLITAIPEALQHGISAGIGIFIAYIGFKNANLFEFTVSNENILSINGEATTAASGEIGTLVANGGVLPALVNFTDTTTLVTVIGLMLTVLLIMRGSRISMLLGITVTTILTLFVTGFDFSQISLVDNSIVDAFRELGTTFGVIFTSEGLPSLFSQPERIPLMLMTVFAFSLADVFDTVGTFIGTGRKTGIFSQEDEDSIMNSSGNTKMERALFGDSVGTIIGAIMGTSNTTTFVESAAGIGAGGRTGMTSVVTAICFILAAFLSPLISIVPANATAPALIAVGIMMMSSLREIDWDDFSEAVPAFFASIFMGLAYSISNGIAAAFIFYGLIKTAKGEAKEVHPIIWVSIFLFILNYIIMAII